MLRRLARSMHTFFLDNPRHRAWGRQMDGLDVVNPSPTNSDGFLAHRSEDIPRSGTATTHTGPDNEQGKLSEERISTHWAGPANGSLGDAGSSVLTPPRELENHPRYEILEVLGSGGMGTVYKARHRFMDRVVALKVIHAHLLNRPEIIARFGREVRVAARLAHPNIVTAYDAETFGSLHFLVLEFVVGNNLADAIAGEGPLPVERACDYAQQVAVGLQCAFEQGMVHRDIKPHNLIRTMSNGPGPKREVVKILDFGLARLVQELQEAESVSPPPCMPSSPGLHTEAGVFMGTPNYMAPEQADDPHSADIRADIYALGCTLYHLLVGHPPFRGMSAREKREMHRRMALRPITHDRPDVPSEVAAVVAKMMAKDPSQRYQTPGEVAEALAAVRTCVSPPPHTRAFTGRRIWLTGALLGMCLTVAGLAAYPLIALRPPSASDPDPQPAPLAWRLQGHASPIFCLAFSPDGQALLSGSKDGTVWEWDLAANRQRRGPYHGHTGIVRGVVVCTDNRRALSASEDGTVRVWELASCREIGCFVPKPADRLTCIALSPNGKYVLCGGEENSWLWEVATGKLVRRLPQRAEGVAFAPNGRRAVTGGWDKELQVWDVESGRLLATLSGHSRGVKAVAFSSDDKCILSVGEDRKICLWDADQYELLREWKGHKHWIWGVQFLPDGRRALTAGWDRTARLWNLEEGVEIQRFTPEPESEELCCVTLSPEGRVAACGGADGLIYLWKLPP